MFRTVAAVLLCCSLLAVVVPAAPVPPYRPRPSKVWITGWDRPVVLAGDCRFERDGARLTIAAPDGAEAKLLRDAEGDFAAEVRVGGDLRAGSPSSDFRSGGLRVEDPVSGTAVSLLWTVTSGPQRAVSLSCRVEESGHAKSTWIRTNEVEEVTYLRLVRRGEYVHMAWTRDSTSGEHILRMPVKMAPKLKVGVTARGGGPGPLKAVFDDFKLTPLGRGPKG